MLILKSHIYTMQQMMDTFACRYRLQALKSIGKCGLRLRKDSAQEYFELEELISPICHFQGSQCLCSACLAFRQLRGHAKALIKGPLALPDSDATQTTHLGSLPWSLGTHSKYLWPSVENRSSNACCPARSGTPSGSLHKSVCCVRSGLYPASFIADNHPHTHLMRPFVGCIYVCWTAGHILMHWAIWYESLVSICM